MEQLCKNIKMFREIRQVTRKDLAAFLGITEQALGKYEDGSTLPSIPTLQKIADRLEVDIRAFFDATPQQIFNFYNSQYSDQTLHQQIRPGEVLLEKILTLLEKINSK